MLNHPELTLAERRALCRADATLDGVPAAICGAFNDFAKVVALPHGASTEWSWLTVQRVVAGGGDFRTGCNQRPA